MRCLRSLVPRIQSLGFIRAKPFSQQPLSSFPRYFTSTQDQDQDQDRVGGPDEDEDEDEDEEPKGRFAGAVPEEDDDEELTPEQVAKWMPFLDDAHDAWIAENTDGWEEKVKKWDEDYWRRGSAPFNLKLEEDEEEAYEAHREKEQIIHWKDPDWVSSDHDRPDDELDYNWHQSDPDTVSDFWEDNHPEPGIPAFYQAGRGRRMYIIHRSNPGKWTPRRLAREFNITLEHCKMVLKAESIGQLMRETFPTMSDHEFLTYFSLYAKDIQQKLDAGKKNVEWNLGIEMDDMDELLDHLNEVSDSDEDEGDDSDVDGGENFDTESKHYGVAGKRDDDLKPPRKGVAPSGDVGYNLPLDWDWSTSRLDLVEDLELFRRHLKVEEKKLRFLTKTDKLEMAESYVLAQNKFHYGREIPETPTRRIGTQREPQRSRWCLVENNKKRDHIFQIAFRNQDGTLNTPSNKEFNLIRRKEKGGRRPFVHQEFQPIDTPPNLERYGPPKTPITKTPIHIPPLPASRKIPKVWAKKKRGGAAGAPK